MTRFTFQGSGQTAGGDGALKAIVTVAGVGVAAILASQAASGAARALGEYVVIGAVTLVATALGAGLTLLAVRLRGRRAARPVMQAQLWRANPQAIPVQGRRELPAPVVNVNIDAGLLAGLMNAAQQQQAVRVITPSDAEELPR